MYVKLLFASWHDHRYTIDMYIIMYIVCCIVNYAHVLCDKLLAKLGL